MGLEAERERERDYTWLDLHPVQKLAICDASTCSAELSGLPSWSYHSCDSVYVTSYLLAIYRGPLRQWLKVFTVLHCTFWQEGIKKYETLVKFHWLQTQKRCELQNFIFQSVVDLDLAWQSTILGLVKTNIGSSAVLRQTVLMPVLYSKPLTEDVLYSWWNRLWLDFKYSWLLKEKKVSVKNVSSNSAANTIACSGMSAL